MHQWNQGHEHDEQEKLRQRFRHLSLLLTLVATLNSDNYQPTFHHRDVIQEKLCTINNHCRNPEPTPMEAALGVFVRGSETLAAMLYGAENLIVAHLMEPNDTSNDLGRNHSYPKAQTVATDYQHSSTTDEAGAPYFVPPDDGKH
jgi:hypothetical protein